MFQSKGVPICDEYLPGSNMCYGSLSVVLQLSMASAACVYSPNISHRCILNGNGAKCR